MPYGCARSLTFAAAAKGLAMKTPIVVHTDEDYEQAQRRVAELSTAPDSPEKAGEIEALAEAMLAFELRRDEAVN